MQQDMQYVYELYKEGNFSKAAAKLFISQPALSMAIQKTEASIGMPLFDRSTRPMRLTPAGEIYEEGNNLYERSMKIFENAGFSPSVKIQLSQLVTAQHLAESGFAATFISDRLIKYDSSNLNYFKLEDKESLRTFYILSHPDRYISNAVSAFIDYIQDYFEVKL